MENLPTYRLTQSGPETQEILDQVNLNTIDIEQLKRLYQALNQSDPEIIEPNDTWPVANPEENVIYRVIDRVNTPPQYYSDYMWNGTSMVLMGQYNNAIDNEPTANSTNLVKSGGVYSFVHANGGAYDISAAHAVGGVLATYDDLADALGTNGANVPAAVRKGGMSIKYVNSSDKPKYVRYNYLISSVVDADFANVANWQGVDEKPTLGSKNTVESNGIFQEINSLKRKNGYVCVPNADLGFSDEQGNLIAIFNNGDFKTKNFDSSKQIKNIRVAENELVFADEEGYIILQLKGGHIITKNFNSSKVSFKPYTSTWERFTVKINRTPVGKFNNTHVNATDSPEPNVSEKTVTGVIALPSSYSPDGKPTRLLCFCHGTNGNVTQTQWYNNNSLMIEHFVPFWLSQGYAVFDCNGVADGMDRYFGTMSAPCGLPDTMQAYLNCYDYLIENYNFEPQIFIWGCSDGGPVPLNWAFMRPGTIAAIADCDPVIDLKQDAWDGAFSNLSLRRQNIAERLGFSNTTSEIYENDRADIWNPFAKIVEIDNKKYAFGFNVPIFLACTASGSYFSSSTFHIREEFAEALENGGTICQSKWYETLTHDDVAMGGSDIVLNDVLKWFNRF